MKGYIYEGTSLYRCFYKYISVALQLTHGSLPARALLFRGHGAPLAPGHGGALQRRGGESEAEAKRLKASAARWRAGRVEAAWRALLAPSAAEETAVSVLSSTHRSGPSRSASVPPPRGRLCFVCTCQY